MAPTANPAVSPEQDPSATLPPPRPPLSRVRPPAPRTKTSASPRPTSSTSRSPSSASTARPPASTLLHHRRVLLLRPRVLLYPPKIQRPNHQKRATKPPNRQPFLAAAQQPILTVRILSSSRPNSKHTRCKEI